MKVATQTLHLLEQAVALDQGAFFRVQLRHEVSALTDAFRGEESPHRQHLGASIIGRECPRDVWYTFRWATRKKFSGRMVRLFNRGHLEEARFIALLKAAKLEVWTLTPEGHQFRITDDSGHFGGSLDSVIRGIPELGPEIPLLSEFKTHGDKSFQKLLVSGVASAKWEHYIQMQLYMGKMALAFALYLAVNKNDDELYAEIVQFCEADYARYLQRAQQIIFQPLPPKRINESPSWFLCKFCDHLPVCHGKVLADRTCRSCIYALPQPQKGEWACTARAARSAKYVLTVREQLAACGGYSMIKEFSK